MNTRRPAFLPSVPLAAVILAVSADAILQIHTLVGRFLAGSGQSGDDFFLDLSAARIGLEHGWAAVYDRQLYGQVTGYGGPLSFVNLPAIAWLAVPLTHLPFRVGLLVWLTGLSTLLLASWWLAAPGGPWQRLAHLAALLAATPVLRAMDVGQFSLAVVGLLALHWWLVVRGRVALAGVALGLACLKPQGVFLVPVALALTGRWRCAAAWLATVAGLGLAMALALGPAGVAAYVNGLRFSLDPATTVSTLWQHLPSWVPTLPIRAAIALLALVPALFDGARHYGRAVAAAVVGSLLGTPYLIGHEQALLFVGGWLTLRSPLPRWAHWTMVPSYLAVALPLGPVPPLCVEVAWLLVLALLALRPARHGPGRPTAPDKGSVTSLRGDTDPSGR